MATRRSLSVRPSHRALLENLEGRILLAAHTWTGAGASAAWSDVNNWTGGVPVINEVDCDLTFPAGAARPASTNDIGALKVRDLTLDGAFVLLGNSLTVSGTISVTAAGTTATISNQIALGADVTIATGDGATAAHLLLGGAISGAITEDLTKTGIGTLTITRPLGNAYQGNTFINEGTVVVNSPLPFGNNTGVATVANNFVISGTGVANAGAVTITGTGGISGDVTIASDATIKVDTTSSLTLSGELAGGGDLLKTGTGTLVLSGTGNLAQTIKANAGTVRVTGNYATSDLTLAAATTLTGTGSLKSIDAAGGTVAPGSASGAVGTLTFANGLTFVAGVAFTPDLTATTGDKLTVTGAVDVSGSTLTASLGTGLNPAIGTVFTLIDNDGADAVTGTFTGLAENAQVIIGGKSFRISYAGGTGNDVTLTRSLLATTTTLAVSDPTPVFGEPITLTATVTNGVAGSVITFLNGTTSLGTGTLSAGGTASLQISSLAIGLTEIDASYPADAQTAASTTATNTDVTVAKADSVLTLTGQAIVGDNKPMTITVSAASVSPSTAAATFFSGAVLDIFDGVDLVGTVTLGANGTGTTAITLTGLGDHALTAVFAGDANFNGDTSNTLTVTVGNLALYAAGTDSSPYARVQIFNADSTPRGAAIVPYGTTFKSGVRVAMGDINGDGISDVVVSPANSRIAEIRVYSGADGAFIGSFNAFAGTSVANTFKSGVYVAAGDIDGDGKDDIVVSPRLSQGGLVQVFSGASVTGLNVVATRLGTFKPYTATYSGGVRVAVGDYNDDGHADIAVSPNGIGSKIIKIFSGAEVNGALVTPAILKEFSPYNKSFTYGITVSLADMDNDGKADIFTISGVGRIRGFNATDAALVPTTFIADVRPYTVNYSGGFRILGRDLDSDGIAEIIVSAGSSSKNVIKIYALTDLVTPLQNFRAFGTLTTAGAWVG